MKLIALASLLVLVFSACSSIHVQKESSELDGVWIQKGVRCEQGKLDALGLAEQKDFDLGSRGYMILISGNQSEGIYLSRSLEKTAHPQYCLVRGKSITRTDELAKTYTISNSHNRLTRVNVEWNSCQDGEHLKSRTHRYVLNKNKLELHLSQVTDTAGEVTPS